MRKLAIAALFSVVVAGCSNEQKSTDPNSANLTKRQNDSILAQSKVPGAKPVGKAMTAADSASARAADFDKLQDTIH